MINFPTHAYLIKPASNIKSESLHSVWSKSIDANYTQISLPLLKHWVVKQAVVIGSDVYNTGFVLLLLLLLQQRCI